MADNFRKAHTIAILMALAAILKSTAAGGYRTDLLARMAATMHITAELDTLRDGEYYRHILYNNRPVTVIVKEGEVTHIGYSVFTPYTRSVMNSPVCNFLERYALETSMPIKREKSVERQLEEDGVTFQGSDFRFFRLLEEDTTYTVRLEKTDRRRYMVSWEKDGQTQFSVGFPVEHDLLAGTNIIENERRILPDILRSSSEAWDWHLPDSAMYRTSWQGKYYVLPGDYYYTKDLNADLYFEKDSRGESCLFYHPNYVLESLRNMMITAALENSYDIQIRLVKYDFSQDTITVKLGQWLNYCLEQGCRSYFGIISMAEGTCDCELIMRNFDMGYIHLMRMSIDISTLGERKGLITARLNSYISTSRVKYLFDEIKT